MDDIFKKIAEREDGFLEVTLKRIKDFDDYIYQQMQKDSGCLPCVRDPKIKNKLYYDTKGYVSLATYLQSYLFIEKECIEFLIYVLEAMIQVNTAKPVYLNLNYIYLSYDGGILRFLVIPVESNQWVFQKEQVKDFIISLIHDLRITEGYEVIGYLTYVQRYDELSLPMVLQGLHDLLQNRKEKLTFLEKFLHLKKEEAFFVKDIPLPKAYPQFSIAPSIMDVQSFYKEEHAIEEAHVHQDTVMLLQPSKMYLFDEDTKTKIAVSAELFTIGRAKDNVLCIPKQYVSAHHACIHLDTNEIEDLSSSNGTYVNDEKITKLKLQHQDVVMFAKKKYIVVLR